MDMTRHEIEKKIQSLPSGGLTKKKINGKTYIYYQWTEDKKQHARVVKEKDIEYLSNQIAERKELQDRLKRMPSGYSPNENDNYISRVIIGEELESYASSASGLKKRKLYDDIEKYIYGNSFDKVLILYGLRRTGKTTLIRQIIHSMNAEDRSKVAFIQTASINTLSDINKDLKNLWHRGFKYVFIDEVTLMEDFIEGAALLSDVYAAMGMKIVLSGTDSLSFLFAEDEQLYDRCIILHTTFIPFKEFRELLEINDIDEFIKYGGTLSPSGIDYNSSVFNFPKTTEDYINSSIAHNIQHSLKFYQHESHFRSLRELYEKHELTNAISRVVGDINHRFTREVLTRTFKSHDFRMAKKNLRNDKTNPTDILDSLDEKSIDKKLMDMLEILNKDQMSVEIKDYHENEIKEYLSLLELIEEIPSIDINNISRKNNINTISQPGLRYSQAEALVKALLQEDTFVALSSKDKKFIKDRIMDDVKGRILEELILLETKKAHPDKNVFKLLFPVGEFDMVIFDEEELTCQIFEIKHSKERHPEQYHHLINREKCSQVEFKFGTITERTVLYRGEDYLVENGIIYKNIEKYLCAL